MRRLVLASSVLLSLFVGGPADASPETIIIQCGFGYPNFTDGIFETTLHGQTFVDPESGVRFIITQAGQEKLDESAHIAGISEGTCSLDGGISQVLVRYEPGPAPALVRH